MRGRADVRARGVLFLQCNCYAGVYYVGVILRHARGRDRRCPHWPVKLLQQCTARTRGSDTTAASFGVVVVGWGSGFE